MKAYTHNQSFNRGLVTGYFFATASYLFYPLLTTIAFTATVAAMIYSAGQSPRTDTVSPKPRPQQNRQTFQGLSRREPAPYRYAQRVNYQQDSSSIVNAFKAGWGALKSVGSLTASLFKAGYSILAGTIKVMASALSFGFYLGKVVSESSTGYVVEKPVKLKKVNETPDWLKAQQAEFAAYKKQPEATWAETEQPPAYNPAWQQAQEPSAPPYESDSDGYYPPPAYDEVYPAQSPTNKL